MCHVCDLQRNMIWSAAMLLAAAAVRQCAAVQTNLASIQAWPGCERASTVPKAYVHAGEWLECHLPGREHNRAVHNAHSWPLRGPTPCQLYRHQRRRRW